MKKGDKIRIHLHGHSECDENCEHCGGVYLTPGTVVQVLREGCVKATIDDTNHPLAMIDNKPRVLTVGPEMYEAIA